jgi:hypothetical protein
MLGWFFHFFLAPDELGVEQYGVCEKDGVKWPALRGWGIRVVPVASLADCAKASQHVRQVDVVA